MAKPKIRFKGYTNDWEQRKLGELSEIRLSRIETGMIHIGTVHIIAVCYSM